MGFATPGEPGVLEPGRRPLSRPGLSLHAPLTRSSGWGNAAGDARRRLGRAAHTPRFPADTPRLTREARSRPARVRGRKSGPPRPCTGGARGAGRGLPSGNLKPDASRKLDEARHPPERRFPGVTSPGGCRQRDASTDREDERSTARFFKASSLKAPSRWPVTPGKVLNLVSQQGNENSNRRDAATRRPERPREKRPDPAAWGRACGAAGLSAIAREGGDWHGGSGTPSAES